MTSPTTFPAYRHHYGIYRLTEADREAFHAHMLSLDKDARRLRFGAALPDDTLLSLVARMPLEDGSFGLFMWGELKGCVLMLPYGKPGHVELAVSLSPDMRGRGWGTILVAAALERAGDRHQSHVEIMYLRGNQAMHRIACRLPGKSESCAQEVHKFVPLADVDFDTSSHPALVLTAHV